MPCTYYAPGEELAIAREQFKVIRAELDHVTALLCEVCTKMEKEKKPITGDLASWWVDHKKRDAERRARQDAEAAAKKESERKQALKELYEDMSFRLDGAKGVMSVGRGASKVFVYVVDAKTKRSLTKLYNLDNFTDVEVIIHKEDKK